LCRDLLAETRRFRAIERRSEGPGIIGAGRRRRAARKQDARNEGRQECAQCNA